MEEISGIMGTGAHCNRWEDSGNNGDHTIARREDSGNNGEAPCNKESWLVGYEIV